MQFPVAIGFFFDRRTRTQRNARQACGKTADTDVEMAVDGHVQSAVVDHATPLRFPLSNVINGGSRRMGHGQQRLAEGDLSIAFGWHAVCFSVIGQSRGTENIYVTPSWGYSNCQKSVLITKALGSLCLLNC